MRLVKAILFAVSLYATPAAAAPDENKLVLVMLDGMRWQEAFHGADPALAADPAFRRSDWAATAKERFVDVGDKRAALMPFVSGVMAGRGAVIGDRAAGSCARVTNDFWFSYPGYNEVLTGKPDSKINSNEFGANPNVTFLEWLNRQPAYKGKVRAYGSWKNFTEIVNAPRAGVPVNAGYQPSGEPSLAIVDRLLADTASPWRTVRLDAFTQVYALEALRTHKPRVMFVSFGETDDFAHEGDYAQYLLAANRSDRFIKELWDALEADPDYRGVTTMIVTIDHGRGSALPDGWRHHYSRGAVSGSLAASALHRNGIAGSDEVWIAAIGPNIAPGGGKAHNGARCAGLNQIAATALSALGEDWRAYDPAIGAPLTVFKGRPK